jgi:hypothetical protein
MPDRIPVTVVRNGGLDFLIVLTRKEEIIASLLLERAAYEKAGNLIEVAGVDAELAYHGYETEPNNG